MGVTLDQPRQGFWKPTEGSSKSLFLLVYKEAGCIEVNGVGLFEYVRGGLEVHNAQILTRIARFLDYSCTAIVLPQPDPLTHRLIWNLSTPKNPGSGEVSVSAWTMNIKY